MNCVGQNKQTSQNGAAGVYVFSKEGEGGGEGEGEGEGTLGAEISRAHTLAIDLPLLYSISEVISPLRS